MNMSISRSAWQQAQNDLLEDFLNLWLPPTKPFTIDPNYPNNPSMEALFKERCRSVHIPQKTLVLVDNVLNNYPIEGDSEAIADWATLFEVDLLQGFGHDLSSEMKGPTFEGLKELAAIWGLYLANKMKNSIFRWEVISTLSVHLADMLDDLVRQIPSRELGDAVRGSITPAYIRAGATVRYSLALLDGNQRELKETLDILQASDADLNEEIKYVLRRHPADETGRELQQKVAEMVAFIKDVSSNDRFAKEFEAALPAAFRLISWFVGYRLRQNMEYNRRKVKALFEAINSHKEIEAAVEQYHYKYAWQGDRNNAALLAWQALAPKYFHLSPKIEKIHEDENQEKLIGMQQGLEQYVDERPAIVALEDGLLGRLGAYLNMAAKNEQVDYIRKQVTDGNRIQTEGKHISDLRYADNEEEEELPNEEILSREKEKRHPSKDAIAEELEFKEILSAWRSLLTESEKTATNLKGAGYTQEEIAKMMGISQQRVSQLLRSALAKYLKLQDSPLSP
jgi:RNA polymerase sigma factor (sigma-70 family)